MFTLNTHAVPLRTNDKGAQLKALGVAIKAEDMGDRVIRMVASTEDVDRGGDIIRADGWVLDAYLKNPVVLWGHDHNTPAIATASKTWVQDKRLMQDWYFNPEYESELSKTIYSGYRTGTLKASSVGFMPLVYENREPPEDSPPDTFYGLEFKKQELFEVSAVNVPANPEALHEMQAKGIDTKPLEQAWQHLEGFVIEVKDDEGTMDELTDAVEAEGGIEEVLDDGQEGPMLVCTGDEEATTALMIEELEARGYRVVSPDDINVDDGIDLEIDTDNICLSDKPLTVELDLKPKPSITEADAEALARSILAKVAEDTRKRVDMAARKAAQAVFDYHHGILTEK